MKTLSHTFYIKFNYIFLPCLSRCKSLEAVTGSPFTQHMTPSVLICPDSLCCCFSVPATVGAVSRLLLRGGVYDQD